ncbi:S-layer homology domain-containing protein [Lysinibacillus sp. FSL P2-0066]|uniref:S-layer homology domain-containing protein n=1 Tax=Lysinibacillus sp. FSL P2-0066 TaxID=2921720 RepID=UPI0030D81BEE
MDKSKIQKVNKALIATVFASSGIAVVVPPPKAAAASSPFTDINQYTDHYNDILKLYSQGVIKGFADNTFRPDVNVTRGQAAKMLATVLKLDTKNIQDPYFKDVPKGSEYYKYVAALQNAGIMSGYSNGTFMPNEVITRGELAKMVVVGFHLEVSQNYNNIFKDVNSQTSNALYIQTVIDLNITEGTTPVTFSPFAPVTRGQFASFVVGSQEKKSNETSFKITSVEDDTVYVNGESYTIPEHLSHIFNDYNAPVLKGAYIEGDLSGKVIRSISKLTLNASGTSSRSLDFDGNYGSFGATIIVNGNYIEFSNMTLTGTMFVNETVRPPLHIGAANHQPLALGRVASNNISFINWSNPDNNKGEDSSSNNSNDLQNWTKPNTDNDKPFVNWSKEKEEMKNVEKYLEFYNSSVSRLVVSQTGTKIETNTKLPRVDIIGNVREFEIQGNIGTLNLNTETKLTIYGSGNIDWINYNSYTDLELYIDGRIGTLFVDNAYGKIDIGDYTYIDKVILPKDVSPNDIFDDFLDDKDNVGEITDPDGKPIDKDDNENQNPDDKTKPLVSITELQLLNGSEIQVDFTSDEVGTYYYIVREKDVEAPNKSEMVNRLSNKNVAHGTGAAIKGKNTIKVSNLGEKKEYVIYIMVVDGSKNASDIVSQSFQMKDASPPVVKSLQVTPLHGGTRAEFKFTASEPGDYYYYLRPKTTAPDPTTADIVANPTGKGKAKAGALPITGILTGLQAETGYQLYVVMKDESGNFSVDPAVAKDFTTKELDNIHPFVENKILERKGLNQVYVYFNERLDKETAQDVKNYELSGTGIINVTGQKVISPEEAIYEEYGSGKSRVLLKVPSLSGFINHDTLTVTVLPGVKDLAFNDFENISTVPSGAIPNNYAEYMHSDIDTPKLKIEKVMKNAEKTKIEVEFSTDKAGTFYYMIMPQNTDMDALNIDSRDFIDEFTSKPSGKFDNNSGAKIYLFKEGEKIANRGNTKFDIVLSDLAVDPFTSYSVYMVVKDRSGNLSIIEDALIADDSKPPLIGDIQVTPKGEKPGKPGEETANLTFNSDEKGNIYYAAIPKYKKNPVSGVLELNPDIYDNSGNIKPLPGTTDSSKDNATRKAAFLSAATGYKHASLDAGNNKLSIDGLIPHEEYVLYIGVEDTPGNFTVQQRVGTTQEYGDVMMKPFYADGTAPKIDPIIKKITEYEYEEIPQLLSSKVEYEFNKTFVITFSEAISISDSSLDIPVQNKEAETLATLKNVLQDIAGTTIKNIKWQDLTDVPTWKERKLIITFDDKVTSDITVDMNSNQLKNITDLGKISFSGDTSIGKYKVDKSPNDVNILNEAVLEDQKIIGDTARSTKLTILANLKADSNWKQRFYYATSNNPLVMDQETVHRIIKSVETKKLQDNMGSIILVGADNVVGNEGNSFERTFNAAQSPSSGNTNVFMEGQYFYLFTLDQYGNVIWAQDSKDENKKYKVIKRQTN